MKIIEYIGWVLSMALLASCTEQMIDGVSGEEKRPIALSFPSSFGGGYCR